jgi:stringent starvation protein B
MSPSINMTSNKPYLIRALYDWILDNDLTPYIAVDCSVYGVIVPQAYINENQIVLNISPASVGSISMQGDCIEFSARFGGKLENLSVPYGAVGAIYAKENGAGSAFPIEHPAGVTGLSSVDNKNTLSEVNTASDKLKNVEKSISTVDGENNTKKAKQKPSLKVIK